MKAVGHLRRLLGYQWRRAWVRSRGPSRYDSLACVFEGEAVNKRRIMEIGTYTGSTAGRLLRIALRYEPRPAVHYYGFDLFEELEGETLAREASKRSGRTMEEVRAFLMAEIGLPADNIQLYRGLTRDTLWAALPSLPPMGFIFIDGGHSTDTVANDWEVCRRVMDRQTIVVFDDYYHFDY
ncbi:MAG: class I SAM-dependent methyltransferase, partial [Gemmatimonadota bacterium]